MSAAPRRGAGSAPRDSPSAAGLGAPTVGVVELLHSRALPSGRGRGALDRVRPRPRPVEVVVLLDAARPAEVRRPEHPAHGVHRLVGDVAREQQHQRRRRERRPPSRWPCADSPPAGQRTGGSPSGCASPGASAASAGSSAPRRRARRRAPRPRPLPGRAPGRRSAVAAARSARVPAAAAARSASPVAAAASARARPARPADASSACRRSRRSRPGPRSSRMSRIRPTVSLPARRRRAGRLRLDRQHDVRLRVVVGDHRHAGRRVPHRRAVPDRGARDVVRVLVDRGRVVRDRIGDRHGARRARSAGTRSWRPS